jgi:ring-1,2-phenylacetyl-CoA epoxidase subunit PaaC
VSAQAPARTDFLLELADDELVLGWRNSEWTGIAPFLEEDVAFSSIAQNEIGHARALYEIVSRANGSDADVVAFDRAPDEYRAAPLVQLQLVPDWAATIARHYLYETADAIRVAALKAGDDAELAALAAKIEREEAYHLMHAQMWHERLSEERAYTEALDRLWPYAVAMLDERLRPALAEAVGRDLPSITVIRTHERGAVDPAWPALWEEMTMVRRSVPGATW